MTDNELKKLKDDLWHSADMLRAGAHLSANKYGQPILGLIFLRYADILYKQHKDEIEEKYNKLKGTRMEKSMKEAQGNGLLKNRLIDIRQQITNLQKQVEYGEE